MVQGSRRRGRIFIYIALILILGLVLVWALMRGQLGGLAGNPQPQVTAAPQEEMVDIVITTQPVARGTVFTEAVLTTIRYPQKEVIEGTFFTSIADVIGKVSKIDLAPRVPVTTSLVVETAEGSFAAFQVPQGMVAIPIPIDSLTSVSYAPQPGDHVNVIVSMLFVDLDTDFQSSTPNNTLPVVDAGVPEDQSPLLTAKVTGQGEGGTAVQGRAELDPTLSRAVYVVPSEPQRPRLVSQTLLQDAVVLQLGLFPMEQLTGAAALQPTPTPVPQNPDQTAPQVDPDDLLPRQLTLIVTPQDAVTLAYLVNNGAQLTLALRGAGDEQRVQTEAVTLQYLMDQYNIPVPAKLPYGNQPRINELRVPSILEPTAVPR